MALIHGTIENSINETSILVDADGRVIVNRYDLLAGEQNPDSSTNGWLRSLTDANVTEVDASAGDVTDQAISSGAPAALIGWYVTAGSLDTLVVKDGTTTRFSETVGAGDASADIGAVPPGCALRFETDIRVSLTTTGKALIFWRAL